MDTPLSEKLQSRNVILASKSPRRQELLKGLISEFTIRVSDVDEVYPEHLKREEIAIYLAELKAKSLVEFLQEAEVLISSDTIVCIDDFVLNKPQSRDEAKTMLQSLSGNSHSVITGVCITDTKYTKSFSDETRVYFAKLSEEEIDFYIDNFKPYDKAGSYGIQEWIGYIGIEKIEGSYFNVMGLPTQKLYRELLDFIKA